MYLYLTLLVVLCAFAHAQDTDCSNLTCQNGLEDSNLFSGGFAYGSWGLSYVRDSSQPPINAAHSSSIKRALIVIHGNARDASNYFCYLNFAAKLQGALDSTYVIAPHFYLGTDTKLPNAFFWANSETWKGGGRSDSATTRISSFQILDDMIVAFNNKAYFPGLSEVVVVGHSGGGQTVQRYAVASAIDANYTVRYVIENAGSYAYLDTTRPILAELSLPTCDACIADDIVERKYQFAVVNRSTEQLCPTFNNWKMGLDNAYNYVDLRSFAIIRNAYKLKSVTYLLGTDDTCNTFLGKGCGCSDNGLDTECEAELGGYCRLERGVAYFQYLEHYYGQPVHSRVFVPGLGHDGCLMLTSPASLQAIFPAASSATTTTSSSSSTTSGNSTSPATGGSTSSGSTTSASDATTTTATSPTTGAGGGSTTGGLSGASSLHFSLIFLSGMIFVLCLL